MDKETRTRIASLGGKALWKAGKAHVFTTAEGKAAGRKGGQNCQKNLRERKAAEAAAQASPESTTEAN